MREAADLRMLQTLIKKKGYVELPSSGNSMYPIISQGNICRIIAVEPNEISRGDIVLFVSSFQALIGHRLLQVVQRGEEMLYIFKGDANPHSDEPVKFDRIVGKLIEVRKSHIRFHSKHWVFLLWKKMILAAPSISILFRAFLKIKRALKGSAQKVHGV
ncbi:signal peptidase I [Paenibacillus montanisoli]|uniref:Signal peptidase I n=1 Tax=Paenibacillus montanisoli TaxID=2081970 RepID=A0A328U6T3_9BACL|nr:signal peptidase I [Paenibacillus montanisoli]RAP77473.1 signal peptidase I [Paenibacillus montanisoli]